jgi:hypothetical protein
MIDPTDSSCRNGKPCISEFTGEHQLLLGFYLMGRPKASLDEIRAYMANESEDQIVFRPTRNSDTPSEVHEWSREGTTALKLQSQVNV